MNEKSTQLMPLLTLLALTGCLAATDHQDASLKTLVVSPSSLSFTAGNHEYVVAVPLGTQAVTVEPTANDPAASIAVADDGATPVLVSSGESLKVKPPRTGATSRIAISVTSNGGLAHQTYTVDLSLDSDHDASLFGLSPSAGTLSPPFDPATRRYTLTSPFGSPSLTVTPTATSARARVTVAQDTGAPTVVASGTSSPRLSVPPVGMTSAVVIGVTAPDGVTVGSYALTLRSSPGDAGIGSSTPAECGDGMLRRLGGV